MKSRKVIITVAQTGGVAAKKEAPYMPTQPEEIADSAYDCFNSGAAIVHIHARDEDENPTGDPKVYDKIHELIRKKCNIILQDSTGGGGNLTIEQRASSLQANPEMASLNMGILWRTVGKYAGSLFSNTRPEIEYFVTEMKKRGIKPEMEIFHHGMIREVENLISKDLVDPPYYVNLIVGMHYQGAVPGTLDMLDSMKAMLPKDAIFNVMGVGRAQLPAIVHSMLIGGNIRVGMEDNVYYRKGELAKSNAQFVERAVRILKELNLEPATPDEAREILGLERIKQKTTG